MMAAMLSKMSDSYLTLAAPRQHEIKVMASKFIAMGYPLKSVADAAAILGEVRKREHAATHHCFAWTFGIDSVEFKYSDDGEPSGTAGRPIYQAICGRDLQNVLVIVVRYFGGTKLGTGGLTRAYAQATTELLDKAEIIERLICERLQFAISFHLYDRLQKLIHAEHHVIISQQFRDMVTMELDVRRSRTTEFISQLIELTGGKVDVRHEK